MYNSDIRNAIHTYVKYFLCIGPMQDTYTLGHSGDFQTSRYQGIVKATVSYRLQDLKFKISEGSDQN